MKRKRGNLFLFLISGALLIFLLAANKLLNLSQLIFGSLFPAIDRDWAALYTNLLILLLAALGIIIFYFINQKNINNDSIKFTKTQAKEKDILDSLIDELPIFLVGINEDGSTRFINKTMLSATGYREKEVLGNDYLKQFVPPAQHEQMREDLPNFPKTEKSLYNDNILLTKEGKELWVRWYGVPIYDKAKDFQYHLGIGIDLTAQRELEQKLEKQRKIEHLLLETVPIGIIFRDESGRIEFANKQAEQMLGLELGGLKGTLVSGFSFQLYDVNGNPLSEEKLPFNLVKKFLKPFYDIEYSTKDAEGNTKLLSISVVPVLGKKSIFQGSVSSFSDITEQKFKEKEREKLFLSEKEHSSLIKMGNEMIYNLITKQDFALQLEKFLEFVATVLPHDGADISLLKEDHLKVIAIHGYEGEALHDIVKNLRYDINMFALEREVLQSKKPIIISDTSQDSRWVVSPGLEWIRSAVKIPLVFEDEVLGTLGITKKEVNAFTEESLKKIESFIHGLSIALHNHLSYEQLQNSRNDTILAMTKMVEIRDPYTSGHKEGISGLAVAIAQEMGLDKESIETIRIASLVHDIGKITVPSEIINKPGKLTETEFGIIKNYPKAGYEILKDISFTSPIAEIVYQHSEKLDGSGYPRGLKGDEIRLEARVILVADVYEAMSSHRPYRPALSHEAAVEELIKNKGILYDPQVVDACLKVVKNSLVNTA